MFGSTRRLEKRLREEGRRAPADVLAVDQSRMTITRGNPNLVQNTQVILELKLRVRPDGEPPFEAEVKQRFPQLSGPHAGTTVTVLYDPDDHSKVVVDDSEAGMAERVTAMLGRNASLAGNPALAGSIGDLVRDAMADPAGFRERMQSGHGLPFAVPGTGAQAEPEPDPIAQLERLAALRDRGVLTDEELAEQKRRILEGG